VVAPKPEVRQQVRALAENQWREPVVVLYLDDVRPLFEVPGRRKDGTVKGKRLVRRFFWNILRGTVGGVVSAVLSVAGGGVANAFARHGRVTGQENAGAVGLVDAAMRARSPWLVYSATREGDRWTGYSPAHVAVVDTGYVFADNPEPAFLWQTSGPVISPRNHRLTWPDGSVYEFHITGEEGKFVERL
jgi:hypothetical protein